MTVDGHTWLPLPVLQPDYFCISDVIPKRYIWILVPSAFYGTVVIKSCSYALYFSLLFYKAKQDTNLVVCFLFCWLYWRSKESVDIMVHQGAWLGQHSNSALSPSCTSQWYYLSFGLILSLSLNIEPILSLPAFFYHLLYCNQWIIRAFLYFLPSATHGYSPAYIPKCNSLFLRGKEYFLFYFRTLHEGGDCESLII